MIEANKVFVLLAVCLLIFTLRNTEANESDSEGESSQPATGVLDQNGEVKTEASRKKDCTDILMPVLWHDIAFASEEVLKELDHARNRCIECCRSINEKFDRTSNADHCVCFTNDDPNPRAPEPTTREEYRE